ncbi:MAG: VCBS repeat-containing protein [candidate division Zixibacteria bacterium]|nr:VCBS repeat-containing protein [candidate division Zixibacteria bacterium]MDH3938868.1 VCBS repeat-containing protein [candidate division Zixibacteria bacterium]MDH4032246.1 VCBS repeat-containing protein [candidate division Zixibacteria bacterium]
MKTTLVTLLLVNCLFATAWSHDEGIPDTVRIEGDTLQVGVSMPIRMAIANDYNIRLFSFGLISKTLDGGFAKADSIIFVNRMGSPEVLEWRIVVFRDSGGVSPDMTIVSARTFANPVMLAPGNDAVLELYLTGLTPGEMVVDSGFFPPVGKFEIIHEFPHGDYWPSYRPQFVTDTLTVIQGSLPPLLTLPDEEPSTDAGTKVSFKVEAESPEDNVVEIELTEFARLEGGAGTPVNAPSLNGNNPAHFSWLPTEADVGLWSAGFRACDVTGPCVNGNVTIQVVTDDNYLVSFHQVETVDAPGTLAMAHANTDDDPKPELFICSSGLLKEITASLWDLNANMTLSNVYSFGRARPFRTPVVGHLNNDAYPDVAIVSTLPQGLQVFYSDGNNGYWCDSISLPLVDSRGAVLGEFTRDQYLDYVYVGSSGIRICAGSDDPVFLQPVHFDIGEKAMSVNSADFDGDGLDDLAVGTESGLRIFKSDGSGGFEFIEFHNQTYGSLDIEITNSGSDFNNDNIYDLCLATPSTYGSHSEIVVYLGNGDGTFGQRVVRSPLGHVMANCAGDFNNDGDLDIAYVNGSENYCAVLFGDGDGDFTNELRFEIEHFQPLRMDCFDADLDGDLDIVVAASGTLTEGASLILFRNQLDPHGFMTMPIVVSALDNAEIELRAPSGQVVNKMRSSVSSGEYYRRNVNLNTILDDGITVGAVEPGTYAVKVQPKPDANKADETFSLELTVGGYPYRFADKAPMSTQGYEFGLYPFSRSPVYPPPGVYVYRSEFTFEWEGSGSFDFQLATDIEFNNLVAIATPSGSYLHSPPLDTALADLYYWRVKPVGAAEYSCVYPFNLRLADCLVGGNVDHDDDGIIALWDLVWLIDFIFKGGPEPPNLDEANINGLGAIDIADLVYLVDYLFTGGPPPVPCR